MTTTARDATPAPAHQRHGHRTFDRQYIGGTWREGRAGRAEPDLDPYTGETLVEIPLADKRDLDDAYAAARGAQPGWAAMLPMERAAVMSRAAAVMEARQDEIIDWLIREAGSTRTKATMEWSTVNAVMLEAARQAYGTAGFILPADVPGKEARVYRRPVGVVGVISPWNWPLQLSNRSVAPALAVGNAVVLKPASDTPITGGLLLASILEEAGLPPGVLNVVVGAGRDIGDAFVTHPIPRVISFTGSTPVGRGIVRQTADSPLLKRVELELGGNSPLVVLDDADLELAVNAAVFGRFLHQGQICMSTNRVIVDDAIHDDFVDAFAERVRSLKVGNPREPDTAVGPVINQGQLDGHLRRIADARSSGARQLVGGDPDGLVLPPHVFTDISEDHDLVREETFGPIAPILRARGEDDALRLANGTDYGLSSAVFTRDEERGVQFARRIEAGMTHVNDQTVNDLPNNPFGGEKNSGFGRFGGDWAAMAFTTDQWVTVQHEPRPYPFDARSDGASLPSGGG